MLSGRRGWYDALVVAGSRRRQPWVLTGVLITMLGAIWIMQGLDVVDGAFFSNRVVSVAVGLVTGLGGLGLMLGFRAHRPTTKP